MVTPVVELKFIHSTTPIKKEQLIHILHVDDELGLLTTTKQILETIGPFQIETASSVKKAMKKLEVTDFDVIVSDYQMPEKDGLTFLTELRKKDKNIPFILFTGKGREDVAIKALNLGANQYINKVGKPETVYGELSYYLQQLIKKRKIEQALKENEERFLKISSQMPGMVYQFKMNIDGTFCVPFSTNAIKEIFGCSPEAVKSDFSPIINVIHPQDYDKVLNSILFSAENLTLWECEYRVQLPGGSIKWMLGKSVPEKQADGSIIWNGYNVDITERKNAENAIRQQREMLETVTKNTSAGLNCNFKRFQGSLRKQGNT
ncbi:MAG: response regulator [Candidatus Bathyarchaeota archaeon]|nr:response regulator [Candidatus Bathyarchaeum sp.]